MKIIKWFGTLALASVISVSTFISTSEASVYTDFDRIAGSSRFETAIKVSQEGWPSNSTDHVLLAIGDNYPDALSGAPLSKKLNAPILLTKKDSVPSEVLNEIKRVGAENVTVLGGAGTISDAVLSQLKSAGINTTRLAGKNRHATSAMIAEKVGGTTAVIASGETFADSLAIASYAAEKGMPILLTTPGKMLPEVEAIAKNYDKVIVVGGNLAVNDSVIAKLKANGTTTVERVSGKSRYETAAAVVSKFYPSTVGSSLVASGQEFADALTGSALGAKKQKPVLLVKQSSLPSATKAIISEKNVSELTVIGGKIAVSPDALNPDPPPAPAPAPAPEPKPEPVIDVRSLIVEESYKYSGTRYVYGGTTPNGFDCSGFIQYVFKQEGISLPRTTGQMAGAGKAVSYANAKPGDVIILDLNNYRPTTASHAGIYLGNGKIIHAGLSGGVSVMSLNASWANWDKKIVSVRSFVN